MKPVLIITHYYPPETGAAANRICHLAEGLALNGFKVSLATPLPNYPTGKIFKAYKTKNKKKQVENGVEVNRLWIYPSNSKNKFVRLFSMLSYSISLIWFFISNKIPKTVIVQSPPLLVAFTSMFFLRRKKRELILNVSDLWPLAGLELRAMKKGLSFDILEKIERFNYRKADLILGQSNEIIQHVKSIVPQQTCFLYRNFPDFILPPLPEEPIKINRKIKLVYAGLLGVAQGILKLCEYIDTSNIEFHIYGSGQEKDSITAYLKHTTKQNIYYHGQLSRNELHHELLKYDLTIVPLLNRIYGSVPSKIFEYAKLGLPILYFGGGEGEEIIKRFELGWVAESGDYEALNSKINNLTLTILDLEMKQKLRETSNLHFDFSKQLKELIDIV
ncbi:glycosyltransferase family 4 protein [Paucihalobacter sp.]|uniref:glycosyltransferase family 4 protein n=1 Tax=Paucihalobacter sp. TaxID=2850405 RepID=UPI002FE30B4D